MLGNIPALSAFAAGSITLTVVPSKPTVLAGEEIEFSIMMSDTSGTNLFGFQFDIPYIDELNYKAGSGITEPAFKEAANLLFFDITELSNCLRITCLMSSEYNGGPHRLASLTYTAITPGNYYLGLNNIALSDDLGGNIDTIEIPAEITVNQPIPSLNVNLTAPVMGATPVQSVSGTGYTGTVEWNGNPVRFAPNTVYTATIVLKADPLYAFTNDNLSLLVNSVVNENVLSITDSELKFTVTFPVTTDKNDVTETITFQDAIYYYNGSPQALPTAMTTDSSGGKFSYLYTGTGDTVYPANPAAPTYAGTYQVTAAYESDIASGAKTASMVINKKAISIDGVTAVSRPFDNKTSIELTGGSLTGVVSADSADVSFILGDGAVSNADCGLNKSVTTNILLYGSKSENYILTQPVVTVDIIKADCSYYVSIAQNMKAGAGLSAITVVPANGIGADNTEIAGVHSWYRDAERTLSATDADLNSLNVDDSVSLYWQFIPNDTNYNSIEGVTNFTIVARDPQLLSFVTPAAVTKTYGDPTFVNEAYHDGESTTKGIITYQSEDPGIASVHPDTGEVRIIAAGATIITATASAVPGLWAESNTSYTLVVHKKHLEIDALEYTIPAFEVFDGKTHAVTVDIKSSFVGFDGVISVKYNGENTMPVNAGIYQVTVDVAEGMNYGQTSGLFLGNLTITPKDLTDAMIAVASHLTYNGSAQSPTFTVKDGTLTLNERDFEIANELQQINAGNYTLTITGIRNYRSTATQTFTINKLVPTVNNLTITIPDASDYNGNPRIASVAAQAGKSGLGKVEIKYNGNLDLPQNAGTYNVTTDIDDGTNYEAVNSLALGTIIINPKPISGIDGAFFVIAGESERYTFDLAKLLPAAMNENQNIAFSVEASNGAFINGTPSIEGNVLTVETNDTAAESDSAEITIGFTGDDNYIISNAIITVSAMNKVIVDISGVDIASRPYNGTPIHYNATKITFTRQDNGEYLTTLNPIFTWSSEEAPTNAGEYSLFVTAEGGADYIVNPLSINFRISKAALLLIAEDKSITENASALPELNFRVEGLVEPDTWMDVYESDPVVSCPAGLDFGVGSYPITIHEGLLNTLAGANYQIAGSIEGVLTITAAHVVPNVNRGSTTNFGNSAAAKYLSPIQNSENDTGSNTDGSAIISDPITPSGYGDLTGKIANTIIDISGHWGYDAINFVVEHALFSDIDDGNFRPDEIASRAVVVSTFGRVLQVDIEKYHQESRFPDVQKSLWYAPYILWADENEIVMGESDGNFYPNRSITREELAAIINRYIHFSEITLPIHEWSSFRDKHAISAWALSDVEQLQQYEILTGKGENTFDPQGTTTRAELAVVLQRLMLNPLSSENNE